MDIREKINELVDKIKKDDDLKKQFEKEPVKTVEKLAGVDLPDGKLDAVVDGIKAKINLDAVSGFADKFKKKF